MVYKLWAWLEAKSVASPETVPNWSPKFVSGVKFANGEELTQLAA
jgi:hypothetical protein